MTALSGRVRRLEQASSNDCPVCAEPILQRAAGFYPELTEATPPVPNCPICGKARRVIMLVRDLDFYRNLDRLRAIRQPSTIAEVLR
jgi:hypothetical protein